MYNISNPQNTFIHAPHFQNGFLDIKDLKKLRDNLKLIPYQQAEIANLKVDDYRKSEIKWITHSKEWDWLFVKIIKYVQDINKKSYNFNLATLYENIQYTEYSSNYKGHYGWHMDASGNYPFNLRKISISIQLSSPDEYEGGDLEIFNGTTLDTPFIVPKTRGTICIFPSFLLHRVTPVTKGTRRSLVVWVGGSHFN